MGQKPLIFKRVVRTRILAAGPSEADIGAGPPTSPTSMAGAQIMELVCYFYVFSESTSPEIIRAEIIRPVYLGLFEQGA